MNEEKNVRTTAEDTGKQESTAQENNVIDTKRKIKFQSPITIVHVPKKEKKQKTTEEPAAEDEKPKEKSEKLKKIKRIVTAAGLVTGAALVGIGTYLKGRGDGASEMANDLLESMNSEEEKEPDPAGVSETSESSDD